LAVVVEEEEERQPLGQPQMTFSGHPRPPESSPCRFIDLSCEQFAHPRSRVHRGIVDPLLLNSLEGMQRTRECRRERRKGPRFILGHSGHASRLFLGRASGPCRPSSRQIGPRIGGPREAGRDVSRRARRVRGEDRDLSKHPIVLSVSRSRVRHVPLFLSFLPGHLSRRSSDWPRRSGTARPPPATASELQRYTRASRSGRIERPVSGQVRRSDGDVFG